MPCIVDVICVLDTLVVVSFCSLWDELSRTHADDDRCGLYFPLCYAVTAITHIVDMISVSCILVVLLFGMHDRESFQRWLGRSKFSLILCRGDHTSHSWRDFFIWHPRRQFNLLFEMSVREFMPIMTGEGLHFPWFYAVTAIPHIIDVISVSVVDRSIIFSSLEWYYWLAESR